MRIRAVARSTMSTACVCLSTGRQQMKEALPALFYGDTLLTIGNLAAKDKVLFTHLGFASV